MLCFVAFSSGSSLFAKKGLWVFSIKKVNERLFLNIRKVMACQADYAIRK